MTWSAHTNVANGKHLALHVLPIKKPQKSCECFWRNIGVWGEGKVEKDGEATGARKGSDVQIRAVSHIFTLQVVRNVTSSVTASYGTLYRFHMRHGTAWNADRLWETHRRQDPDNSSTPYSIANRGRRMPVLLQQSPERPEPCRPHTQTSFVSERANTPSRQGKTQFFLVFQTCIKKISMHHMSTLFKVVFKGLREAAACSLTLAL